MIFCHQLYIPHQLVKETAHVPENCNKKSKYNFITLQYSWFYIIDSSRLVTLGDENKAVASIIFIFFYLMGLFTARWILLSFLKTNVYK